MGLIGPLPRTAQTGANEWTDVETNDARIRDEIDGQLDNANLKAGAAIAFSKLAALNTGQLIVGNGGTATAATLTNASLSAAGVLTNVTDTALSSPNNATYKTLVITGGIDSGNYSAGAGPSILGGNRYDFTAGALGQTPPLGSASGQAMWTTGTSGGYQSLNSVFLYLVSADYSVGALSQKLRLRAQASVNGTAPGINYTISLYPVTWSGAANQLVFTLGTAVGSSSVTLTTPSANSTTAGATNDFAIPGDGMYAIGVSKSGAIALNSVCLLTAQLQTRNT